MLLNKRVIRSGCVDFLKKIARGVHQRQDDNMNRYAVQVECGSMDEKSVWPVTVVSPTEMIAV